MAIVSAFALAACATPQIDRPFGGLRSMMAEAGSSATGDPARLFVIHGMTRTDDDYADKLVDELARGLNFERRDPCDTKPCDTRIEVPGAVGFPEPLPVNLRTYHLYEGDRERLRVGALNWSPLTESIKQNRFQSDDAIPRAWINGEIKTKVMNDGLTDAVLFIGKYQIVMRRAVIKSLCMFLEGAYKDDKCTPNPRFHSDVAFISMSLGSYMLVDALTQQESRPKSAWVMPLVARTRLLYMFANQVPQLELSELTPGATAETALAQPSAATKFGAFLELVRRAHAKPAPGVGVAPSKAAPGVVAPLQIVAFTDPNDLLSYQLHLADLPPDGPTPPPYEPANVLYPNTAAWFGLFADPLTAHTGYSSNQEVLDLVVCGSGGC